MDRPKELTHISLCAGYGGIDLGLRGALGAVRTVAFSEIEAYATENLVAKIEAGLLDAAPIWTDLKTFPWGAFRGAVDILSGGFPCQPFSAAGQRRGDDDPRHLWPHIVRGIRELGHPPLVFFENVEGIISSKLTSDEWSDPAGTPVLHHVLRELERLGYDATAGVFSAREVGLPHQRKRVFILGARYDLTHDQHEWVSSLLRSADVGNTEHNGHPSSSLGGGDDASLAHRAPCGEDSERKLAGAGSALRDGDVSTAPPAPRGADVAHTDDTRDTPHGHHVDAHGATSREGQGWLSLAEPCGRNRVRTAPPAPRGADQYGWEPPRVTDGTWQTEPTLGRDADGFASRMDYEELCHSVDNRTDELRLLGNGVVPATAERAFRVLWARKSNER